MRILMGLTALLAVSGVAAAQNDPCPECDPDGADNPDNTYSSVDLGYVTNDTEVLGDSDWAVSHSDDEKGFWAWLSLCLSAWLAHVEGVLGVDADVDGNVELYLSEDGVDLDATVQMDERVCETVGENETLASLGDDGGCVFGFDRSDLGDADGQTWVLLGDANGQLRDAGVEPHVPFPGEHVPAVDEDLCLTAELELGLCA